MTSQTDGIWFWHPDAKPRKTFQRCLTEPNTFCTLLSLSILTVAVVFGDRGSSTHPWDTCWKSQSEGNSWFPAACADSPCWSMMSSDIVVFHLCCLDPLRFTPPPHPTISISCRHTARIYTNLSVIWIYFPQMLFVSEFIDICNLSWIYQKLQCLI